ncbi:SDR family NAD(P)-dependent oxidoreductase [Bacillus weihaiensis]|uniref:Oxidoreductase n=1 Tax=Bacillus weihaiensis TaxID=1547283 RepID=A0A1L3MNS5_9BACI|nr:3-oxoacyl-ACP reductase family protein [Bacillus weihaiensis]APH03942.1 oxidoreductase [Bacillus weihaiensis]
MNINLENQVALVTGASGGIGQSIAIHLAASGAKVAVNYLSNKQGAEETVRLIEENGGTAIMLQADVTDLSQIDSLVSKVEEQLGTVDILVNNAGHLIERRPIGEMTIDLWQKVFDVNVTSAAFMSKAVIPGMKQKGSGSIINLSSLAAHDGGGPGAVPYATAKGAIITFTKGLAKELAPFGIRVNSISPGFIDQTKFHTTFNTEEGRKATAAKVPLGRGGVPDDISGAALFLISPLSSYITGETIEINGGLFMK